MGRHPKCIEEEKFAATFILIPFGLRIVQPLVLLMQWLLEYLCCIVDDHQLAPWLAVEIPHLVEFGMIASGVCRKQIITRSLHVPLSYLHNTGLRLLLFSLHLHQ